MLIRRSVRRPRGMGQILMVALVFFMTIGTATLPASGAATSSPVGNYAGPTSPVWINSATKAVHRTATMNLSIVVASYGSCGGPRSSRVMVLCLTSGNVDDQGDVANLYNAAPWSTEPFKACQYVSAEWQPAYRIPASGNISLHYTLISRPGTAIASPIQKISATIHVGNGAITGTVLFKMYISGPVTGQKWEPYCSSGSVSFRLHRLP